MFKCKYSYEPEMRLRSIKMRENAFGKFIPIIEATIKKHGAIIGGKMAVNMFNNTARDLDDYQYVIYVTSALKFANELINALAIDMPTEHMLLRSPIANHKFIILINLFEIATIWDIGSKYYGAIKPVVHNKFKLLPPEISLIGIYRDLYDPLYIDAFDANLKCEQCLYKRVARRGRVIIGGANNKRKLIDILGGNCVVVGSAGSDMLLGKEPNWNAPLEVISKNADTLAKEVYDAIKSDDVCIKKIYVPMLEDLTLVKYYISGKHGPIISIYNSANYELIPYCVVDDIKVGTLFVVLRFYMINIWISAMLADIGAVNKKLIECYFREYSRLRGGYKNISADNPSVLAPVDKYYGAYVGRDLKLKYYSMSIKRYPDYAPRQYKKKFGKLRNLDARQKK